MKQYGRGCGGQETLRHLFLGSHTVALELRSQGVSAVAQGPRETIAIQKQQRLVAGLRERLERLPA
jgi:hypothetical protein